jgi:hypothetical protein
VRFKLVFLYFTQGKYEEAEPLFDEFAAALHKLDPNTLTFFYNVARPFFRKYFVFIVVFLVLVVAVTAYFSFYVSRYVMKLMTWTHTDARTADEL